MPKKIKKLLKSAIKKPYRLAQKILRCYGWNLTINKVESNIPSPRNGLNLNVGAGNYVIDGFKNLDFYSEHYYSSKEAFLKERIVYDLRSDNLPFNDGVVDNIYISHVIEHVETEYVVKFIEEAFRVIAAGGVLRVACPDAEFLYQVSLFENDYYCWHPEYGKANQFDMLVHQLATPRFKIPNYGLSSNPATIGYEDFMTQLKNDLVFDQTTPGDHINNWDFDRLKRLGLAAGFSKVTRSKPGGCISSAMQGDDFDHRMHRHMSLYVDMLKA